MSIELDEVLRYVVPLVAVAVAWGQTRSEVAAMKEQIKDHDAEIDKHQELFMRKTECREQHAREAKSFDELKADVKDIKRLLIEFMGRPHA